MRKKGFISILTVFVFLLQTITLPVSAAKNEADSNVAYIYFSEQPEKHNISAALMGPNPEPVVAERDGEKCWLMDVLKGEQSKYIYISLSEDFVDTTGTATYDVEVDYYDYGQGYFTVWYDSQIRENEYYDLYAFEDDRVWKTVEFTIDNAAFTKRLDGKYDFKLDMTAPVSKLSKKSTNSVAVKRIQITRNDNKNSIYVDSEIAESAAAFEWYSDKKIITDHFENRTDNELTVNIRRTAVGEETGAVLFDETEELTFAPREKKDIEFDFSEYEKCEQYEYKIYITSEEDNISSEFTPIRFAVIKTDPDGIKHDFVYMNTYTWQYENYEDYISVLDKSNIGGVREPIYWWLIEPTSLEKGNYYFEGTLRNATELLRENGIQILPILGALSFRYSNKIDNLPSTAEELQGWRDYVKFVAGVYNEYGVEQYEIWNEPDLGDNNSVLLNDGVTYKTGAAYVPVYNAALKEIKAINPDALVIGPGVCGGGTGQQFVDEALEAGWAETVEGISSHPYNRQREEIGGTLPYVEYFKEQVEKYGGKKDIVYWAGEVGYTNADKEVGTEANKGNWNVRKAYYLESTGMVDNIVLFAADGRGLVPYDREDNFQQLSLPEAELYQNTNPFMPLSSMLKIAAQCYVLGDSEAKEKIYYKGSNAIFCEYKSNKFDADVLTMNLINEDIAPYENVTLKLGCDKLDFYDEFGNMTTLYGDDGVYTFTLDERPNYIVGNFDGVEIIEDDIIAYSSNAIDSSENDTTAFTVTKPHDKDYSLSVECGTGIKVVENTGFVNDTATIKLFVEAKKGTNSYVTVSVMEGDKVIQKSRVKISVEELLVPSVEVIPTNSENFNMWTGEMLLYNTSFVNCVKGKLKFTYPAFLESLAEIDIGTIPRQRTGRVKFNLPQIVEKGNYTAEYEITTENGQIIKGTSAFDFTVSAKAHTPPVIDGIMDKGEWREDTAMYLNNVNQVKNLISTEPWRGTDDLSARMIVQWDEENLYFLAEVKDDEYFYQEPINSMYRDDNIQFGIFYGEQGYIAKGQGATTFHEINLGYTKEGPKAYRSRSQEDAYPNGELENYELEIVRTGDITCYEFKIPWKNLLIEGHQPKNGEQLGFSALVNENDGTGRRGWIEYASGIGEQKNTALFTYITLYE